MKEIKKKLLILFSKIIKKKWTTEQIKKYIGSYENNYLAYAQDPEIRKMAASGGVTSALYIFLLEKKIVDGVVVCKTKIKNHKVRAYFCIAKTKNEILDAQGSKYVSVNFEQEVFPLIENFKGKLAIGGLPCHIRNLKIKAKNSPKEKFSDKIFLTCAFVCGHISKPDLIDGLTKKYEKKSDSKLSNFRFRSGLWRGETTYEFENKNKFNKKFGEFSFYQNLWFFSEQKCLNCIDHFGYKADLSIGDVWDFSLKGQNIKHNGIISLTKKGDSIMKKIKNNNILHLTEIDIRQILDGQSRGISHHYNSSARAKAGKKLGIKIMDTVHEPVRFHEFLVAYIQILNYKITRDNGWNHWVFRVPKPILKIYLYFLKGLQSIK